MQRPEVVTFERWQAEREALLAEEKRLTRELDALAARRRRLPMVALGGGHRFVAPDGTEVGLADLFEGRHQLVTYHFMRYPGQDHLCPGCATFTDNIAENARPHLAARDTTMLLMSPAPQAEVEPVRRRMGWTTPWYSTVGDGFCAELGLPGGFALSVLLRDGDEFFLTWSTTGRGVDRLRFDFNLLDLTPYGRREQWEDAPAGWPQGPTMAWLRPHDEYV